MHILLVPSWYPQTPQDFNGSFFREQAQAVASSGALIGVLAVRGIPIYSTQAVRARRREIDFEDDEGILTARADAVLPVPKAHSLNYAVHYRRLTHAFAAYVARNGTPDVLHAHALFPGGILTHRLAAEFGIPFIITEHRPSSMQRVTRGWFRRRGVTAARAADRRIAVAAEFAKQLTVAYGSADKPWEYFPGLLSPQLEASAVRKAPHQPPFVFAHVSHLDPGKRVDLLIDAFADRFAGDERAALRIAGNSAERASLEVQAQRRGVSTQVDFIGAVPREAIAAEFAAAHAFVLPSEKEAFGTVIWEAMASGLPVISSRTWAGLNAVTDEVGLLFDVNDRERLGDALAAMRESFARYDGDRIRAICIDHCGRGAFNALYLEAYERAIRNGFPATSLRARKQHR
ncbi:glycosyltransferase [Rathayibacter soli]|uniref:glycosyltransferase n=1 Tax=Rathayibacter soli TaxID=3144168 RepID=UPI0027E5334A|nr:glycosyltransferase [Glaciibacter superstes]